MARSDLAQLARMTERQGRRRRRKAPRERVLTDRQRAFVEAFAWEAKGNATKAARMAGYKWPGKAGPALVHHPLVNAALHARIGLLAAGHAGPLRCGLLTFDADARAC